MRILSTALLASIACTVQGNQSPGEKFAAMIQRKLDENNPNPIPAPGTGTALESRWKMTEPQIQYDVDTDVFTLDFYTSSPLNTPGDGMQYAFFDFNCQDDGTFLSKGIEEYRLQPVNPMITNETGDGPPELTMDGPGNRPQLKFKVNHALLAADSKLWTSNP